MGDIKDYWYAGLDERYPEGSKTTMPTTSRSPPYDSGMDDHLQLVGVVGLVACLILGIVVIALCVVLFCQKCRTRDSQSRPFMNREARQNSQTLGDEPPDYEWCAENAGYRPDQPDLDSLSNVVANDEIPPTYDHAVGTVPVVDFVSLDVNRLTASEAYKVLAGPRPSSGGGPPS